MARLPSLFDVSAANLEAGSSSSSAGNISSERSVEQLVVDLYDSELRESAMVELPKRRVMFPDLALLLWNSVGIIAALLQEVIFIYPVLDPPTLTLEQSDRICNVLALFQCVAFHQDTRRPFLDARLPMFLYPFLNTTHQERAFEHLRLTSLGVMGALVKEDDSEVVRFILSTEIISICLKTMETGSMIAKTVATFIVHKILMDDTGLGHLSSTAERFFAVSRMLGAMVAFLTTQPSNRLLQQVIRCYLRYSDNARVCVALRTCLPPNLRDSTFSDCLDNDPTTRALLQELLDKLEIPMQTADDYYL